MLAKGSKKRPECTTLRDESEDTGKEATKFFYSSTVLPLYSRLSISFLLIEHHGGACFLANFLIALTWTNLVK